MRIEASGDTEDDVRDALLRVMVKNDLQIVALWELEEPGVQIQTTSRGFWGRLTVRRRPE
jgi:hypothetical protein